MFVASKSLKMILMTSFLFAIFQKEILAKEDEYDKVLGHQRRTQKKRGNLKKRDKRAKVLYKTKDGEEKVWYWATSNKLDDTNSIENQDWLWSQIGQNITGDENDDGHGSSMSISSDGGTLAIGAYQNDNTGTNRGQVRVYRRGGANGDAWMQLGQDLYGEEDNEFVGNVALSSNGLVLAVGAPGSNENRGKVRVFQFNGNVWAQVGQDIDGKVKGDYSSDVALSSDGYVLAIGSSESSAGGLNSGEVRVFRYHGNFWVKVGQDINDFDGFMELSGDGRILTTGGLPVRVYMFTGQRWMQGGQDIEGDSASISSDGSVIASTSRSNFVRIYMATRNGWVQVGEDINGSFQFSSLSSNGKMLAVGGTNGSSADVSTFFRVYTFNQGSWVQVGQEIQGVGTGLDYQPRFSFSGSGTEIATGFSTHSAGIIPENVRVYKLICT